MTEQNETNKPQFKGDGVAIWVNNKDGNKYLAIKVIGMNTFYAWENKPKETKDTEI